MLQAAVFLFAVSLASALGDAAQVPAGTELSVRLTSRVASDTSQQNQKVTAIVIEPVLIEGITLIPSGATVTGTIQEVRPASEPKQTATLKLDFNELQLGKSKLKISSQVASVDNAREKVDDKGTIQGLVPSQTLTALMNQGIGKLNDKYSGLAGILQAAKGAFVKDSDPNISYDAGVEMKVRLLKPLTVSVSSLDPNAAKLQAFPNEHQLGILVNKQSYQTWSQQEPPRKSDITNLMYIGSKEAVEAAFSEAGWSTAAALSHQSKMETARALIEQRGYNEAPVSILILDDRPPDMVYQKGNNTFAARHHLRIWLSPDTFNGMPVWISSATHDIGIDFSQKDMTFIHKINPNIDAERSKVVSDLRFTGKVKSLALVERPDVPPLSQNATGDDLITDGKMAVLLLQ